MNFLDRACKKVVYNKKIEYNHQILHIQNSLGAKFQLKLTIFKFWIEVIKKGFISDLQKEKNAITIKF